MLGKINYKLFLSCSVFLALALYLSLNSYTILAFESKFIDCISGKCPEIIIKDDDYSRFPNGNPANFRGFADPTIRKDPDTKRLWMAYSWPHVNVYGDWNMRDIFSGRTKILPAVESHLSYSDDGGINWQYYGKLWTPTPVKNSDGLISGHITHETPNFLPVKTLTGTKWYAARLDYFVPEQGGYKTRSIKSFRIKVLQADSPAALSKVGSVSLAASYSDKGFDYRLTDLSPELSHCHAWNEHALYYENGNLYLGLSCMSFKGKIPDMPNNNLVVFATKPTGNIKNWKWSYKGKLSGFSESQELGGERLTQIDFAKSRDGILLAIVSPDKWNNDINDFVHMGCSAVEIESLEKPAFARNTDGSLKTRARIVSSDAGEHGTAACTYDPASATGIILVKRDKQGIGMAGVNKGGKRANMSVSMHKTGLHP